MPSAWSDLRRPPLSAVRLRRALEGGPVWREVRVVASTASTNRDVADAARDGAAEGLVVVAEEQTAGRGRLDRTWVSPARSGVLMSALLRPAADPTTWSLLSLLTGLAVAEALDAVAGVTPRLKWPNDVMLGDRKLGGILAERVDGAVVIGLGLNVSTRAEELAVATATSVALAGGTADREPIVKEVLRGLARRYVAWANDGGAPGTVIPAYRERCETIGRRVDVTQLGGEAVTGVAVGVDDAGGLVVRDDTTGRDRVFLSGDVTHAREVG